MKNKASKILAAIMGVVCFGLGWFFAPQDATSSSCIGLGSGKSIWFKCGGAYYASPPLGYKFVSAKISPGHYQGQSNDTLTIIVDKIK